MLTESIKTLSATSPRDFQIRMAETAEINAQIVTLAKQLGVEPGRLSFNLNRAKTRLAELKSTQSAKLPLVPVAAATALPADYGTLEATTREEFYKMDVATRIQFTSKPYSIHQSAKLPLLPVAAATALPAAPVTAPGAKSGPETMTVSQFEALPYEARNEFMRKGGKLKDK